MYEEAQRIGIDDWEIWHNKGLCNMYLKQYEGAADCFKRANAIQRHDATYMQLGKVYTLQEEYKTAIEARARHHPAPLASPRLASPRLASPRLASPRLASPRLASPPYPSLPRPRTPGLPRGARVLA